MRNKCYSVVSQSGDSCPCIHSGLKSALKCWRKRERLGEEFVAARIMRSEGKGRKSSLGREEQITLACLMV